MIARLPGRARRPWGGHRRVVGSGARPSNCWAPWCRFGWEKVLGGRTGPELEWWEAHAIDGCPVVVADAYDGWAAAWHRRRQPRVPAPGPCPAGGPFAWIALAGRLVLDVGSGTGAVAEAVAAVGPVVAADRSHGMLAFPDTWRLACSRGRHGQPCPSVRTCSGCRRGRVRAEPPGPRLTPQELVCWPCGPGRDRCSASTWGQWSGRPGEGGSIGE